MGVVDALEMVDIEHDRRNRLADRDPHARSVGALEERSPIGNAGQRVGGREPHQFVLHGGEPFGGPQACVELLGRRRLADIVVGSAVERFAQLVAFLIGRNQEQVDLAVGISEQTGFPAQLHPRHGQKLAAGDERGNAEVGLDVVEREPPVGKRPNLVVARLQHPADEFEDRTTWIDQHNAHENSRYACRGPGAATPTLRTDLHHLGRDRPTTRDIRDVVAGRC